MEPFRNSWNRQQKQLRHLLTKTDCVEEAVKLFLYQHAALHTAAITQSAPWSFADEIMDTVSEEQLRHLFPNNPHSIAWYFWHMMPPTRHNFIHLNEALKLKNRRIRR